MQNANPFGGGLVGGTFKPLSDDGIKKIHQTAMRIFEEVGFKVANERALKLFNQAGADVDFKTKIVKASESWVMDKIKTAACADIYFKPVKLHIMLIFTPIKSDTGRR